ncbi:unnamed protein product, partial [Iphiclides podalirius]
MGDSLDGSDSASEAQNVVVVEFQDFANYLRRAATVLLPEDDIVPPALNAALDEKVNQDCIRKFISDPQVPSLYVQRFSLKDGDKMAPSVEKKIAELEMGLLHLQQNIDIPEITLPVHPLVAAVIKRDIVKKKRDEHLKMVWRVSPSHKRLQARMEHMRRFRRHHEQLRTVMLRVQQRNLGVSGRIFAIESVRARSSKTGTILKLKVNFLPEIITLYKEVRNLKNLGFRYQVGVARAQTVTYRNLLTKLPGGSSPLENAYDAIEQKISQVREYVDEWLRFYFVGDEDLLEIIGNSKNIARLQKHFKKMFAGVAAIILNEDNTVINGIASREGEEVLQLYQICKLNHGLMMVGPSGSGKSTAWRVLLKALERLRNIPLEDGEEDSFSIVMAAPSAGGDQNATENILSPALQVSITGEWVPWSAKVPQIEVETHKVAAPDVVVPTLDTVRHEALLYTWLAEHKPLVLCGPPGSGKTMTLFSALRALPDMEVVGLNFSSATTPELLLKTFDHYCEYRKTPNGVVLAPVQVGKEFTSRMDLDSAEYAPPELFPAACGELGARPSHRDAVVNACVYVHLTLHRANARLAKRANRTMAITPRAKRLLSLSFSSSLALASLVADATRPRRPAGYTVQP